MSVFCLVYSYMSKHCLCLMPSHQMRLFLFVVVWIPILLNKSSAMRFEAHYIILVTALETSQ